MSWEEAALGDCGADVRDHYLLEGLLCFRVVIEALFSSKVCMAVKLESAKKGDADSLSF